MAVVVRADDEPVASREEFWRSATGAILPGMDLRFETQPDERDQLVAGDLGVIRVIESTSGPGRAFRSPRHVRRDDIAEFHAVVMIEGEAIGEHNGRRDRLGPGDIGLVDLSKPFRCAHRTSRSVFVSFPAEATSLRRDQLAAAAGVRIPGGSGLPALVSSLVGELPRRLHRPAGADQVRFGAAVLELLVSVLATSLGSANAAPTTITSPETLRLRIRAYIEANLADPSLGPSSIAAAHHISVRHLYRLFEAEEYGVAAWVRRRRLDRCRRDLLEPSLRDRPVSAIGARWGFVNPAAFNRAFRDRFGVPPGAYRTSVLRG